MGIRNLGKYVDDNHLVQFRLRDTKLIVDANNVSLELYKRMKKGNSDLLGGDLVCYAESLRSLLWRFIVCRIYPIFVYDGTKDIESFGDKTHKKLFIANKRFGEILKFHRDHNNDRIFTLPMNVCSIFKAIVNEFNTTINYTCLFEADPEIARLSQRYNAPILSDDSDFFLMDLRGGVIPYKHFEAEVVSVNQQPALSCKIFYLSKFIEKIPSLRSECLPLLAIIMGNDIVDQEHFKHKLADNFIFRMPIDEFLPCDLKLKSLVNRKNEHEEIKKALHFLRDKSLSQVISDLASTYSSDESRQGFEILAGQILDHYKILEQREDVCRSMVKLCNETDNFHKLYSHLMKYLKHESSLLLTIMVRKPIIMWPIIESVNRERPTRACTYRFIGVMLALTRVDADDTRTLKVYDQFRGKYSYHEIEPILTIETFGCIETVLSDLPDLNKESATKILLGAMKMSLDTYELKLVRFNVRFKSNEAIQLGYISLMLKYLKRKKRGFSFKQAVVATFVYFGGVQLDESKSAKPIDESSLRRSVGNECLDLRIIDQIVELESTILAFNMLNSILGLPLPRMNIENWFNATIIYNLSQNVLLAEQILKDRELNRAWVNAF